MDEKRGLLPLVSEATRDVVIAEFLERKKDYTMEILYKMSEDNPKVFNMIVDYARSMMEAYGRIEFFEAVIISGVFTYKMLESQAEANNLEKEIFGK